MQPPIVQQEIHYQEMSEVSPPRPYNDFASPMETGSVARKRTYSMFEGLPNSSFTQPSYTARGQHNVYGLSSFALASLVQETRQLKG